MGWINVNDLYPDEGKHEYIMIWANHQGNMQPIMCIHDYGEWCDPVEGLNFEFEYWYPLHIVERDD